MCILVFRAVEAGHSETISHLERIAGVYGPEGWKPESPQDICGRILHTCYLGMAVSFYCREKSHMLTLYLTVVDTKLEGDTQSR